MMDYTLNHTLQVESFLNDLEWAFAPTDAVEDVMHRLTNMTQGKHPAEELVTNFKLALTQAGMMDAMQMAPASIGYFQWALNRLLLQKILSADDPPLAVDGWYKKVIQFDNNYC